MIKKEKGFISLVAIMTISAVALVIASAVLLRSITEAIISVDEESSNLAWAAANACGEIAVWKLATTTVNLSGSWDYNGDVELDVGDNTCYINSIIGTGNDPRTVQVHSTVNNFIRKLQIEVSTNTPAIIVDSWELIADF